MHNLRQISGWSVANQFCGECVIHSFIHLLMHQFIHPFIHPLILFNLAFFNSTIGLLVSLYVCMTADLYTVDCRYSANQYKPIFPTPVHWLTQNINQTVDSQNTLHSSPSRASYGVSIVRIFVKIDRVITASPCICWKRCPRYKLPLTNVIGINICNDLICHSYIYARFCALLLMTSYFLYCARQLCTILDIANRLYAYYSILIPPTPPTIQSVLTQHRSSLIANPADYETATLKWNKKLIRWIANV